MENEAKIKIELKMVGIFLIIWLLLTIFTFTAVFGKNFASFFSKERDWLYFTQDCVYHDNGNRVSINLDHKVNGIQQEKSSKDSVVGKCAVGNLLEIQKATSIGDSIDLLEIIVMMVIFVFPVFGYFIFTKERLSIKREIHKINSTYDKNNKEMKIKSKELWDGLNSSQARLIDSQDRFKEEINQLIKKEIKKENNQWKKTIKNDTQSEIMDLLNEVRKTRSCYLQEKFMLYNKKNNSMNIEDFVPSMTEFFAQSYEIEGSLLDIMDGDDDRRSIIRALGLISSFAGEPLLFPSNPFAKSLSKTFCKLYQHGYFTDKENNLDPLEKFIKRHWKRSLQGWLEECEGC